MTTGTSREAVEALIDTVRNKYGAFDRFHRELADAAAALLDERDGLREDRQMQRESLHHAVERISDLEATNRKIIERSANHHNNAIKWRDCAERAEAERDRLQAAYNKRGDDLVIAYTQRDIARAERDKLTARMERLSRMQPIYDAAQTVKGTGGAVEIGGVRIEPCDEFGATETTRERDKLTAELADETKRADENYDDVHKWRSKARRLTAKLDAVKAYAQKLMAGDDMTTWGCHHNYFAGQKVLAILADTDEGSEQ